MKHIAIEGIDGSGKTTVGKLLAQKLGFEFVTKPLHYLTDQDENNWPNYIRARDIANNIGNKNFSAWFYGLGCFYTYIRFRDKNIVTDRHILSNYAWSGETANIDIFDLIVKKIGAPTLTVILYASEKELKNRLFKRDKDDHDIKKLPHLDTIVEKMVSFCELKHFPYIVINTDSLTPEEITNKIIEVYNNGVL